MISIQRKVQSVAKILKKHLVIVISINILYMSDSSNVESVRKLQSDDPFKQDDVQKNISSSSMYCRCEA